MFSVLHIVNKFDLAQGGPPRSIINIINALKKKKYKTYLISTSKSKKFRNSKSFYFGNNLIDRFSFPNLSLILHLRKKIKEYDIIHIHCIWNFITTISFYFAVFYKKKIVFSPHGTMDKNNIKNNFLVKKIYYYLVEKRNIEKISLVHFLSNEEKNSSKYLQKKKYFIINNGLDLRTFKFKNKLKLSIFNKKKFNILNIGRFNKIKGIDLQFDLIKKINEKKNNYKLILVGPDDKDKKFYKKKSQNMKLGNDVIFLPPDYSKKRFQIMNESDLVINTSYYECNSMVILESLASGALVLAVNNANVNHQFKQKALIKTKRNLKDIVKKIDLLKNNKKMQNKIRKNAINYSKKYLDINILTNKYIKQYKTLLNLNYGKKIQKIF